MIIVGAGLRPARNECLMTMDRKSIRKPGFDYSFPGYYFVTICTHDGKSFLGSISDGVIHPSEIGTVVHRVWNGLIDHYSSLELDSFVLMPNHVHGVVRLVESVGAGLRPAESRVTLTEVVRALKSFSSRQVNERRLLPANTILWQRTFYDRIIRTEKELNIVRLYIKTNPLLWRFDPENSEKMIFNGKLDGFSEEESELVRNYLEYRVHRNDIRR